jgi:hypothetical protein
MREATNLFGAPAAFRLGARWHSTVLAGKPELAEMKDELPGVGKALPVQGKFGNGRVEAGEAS